MSGLGLETLKQNSLRKTWETSMRLLMGYEKDPFNSRFLGVTPGFKSWNKLIPMETLKPVGQFPMEIQFLGGTQNFTLLILLITL